MGERRYSMASRTSPRGCGSFLADPVFRRHSHVIRRLNRWMRSLNAFARLLNCVSKWRVRRNKLLSSSAFSASPLQHEPDSTRHGLGLDWSAGQGWLCRYLSQRQPSPPPSRGWADHGSACAFGRDDRPRIAAQNPSRLSTQGRGLAETAVALISPRKRSSTKLDTIWTLWISKKLLPGVAARTLSYTEN